MAQETKNSGVDNAVAVVPKSVTFTSLKPQLIIEAPYAEEAVLFYKKAFHAKEVSRVMHPKRKADQEVPLILSAELQIGPFSIIVSDLTDDSPVKSVSAGSVICLVTDNFPAVFLNALAAGARAKTLPSEGEGGSLWSRGRFVKLMDPFGIIWLVCALPI